MRQTAGFKSIKKEFRSTALELRVGKRKEKERKTGGREMREGRKR